MSVLANSVGTVRLPVGLTLAAILASSLPITAQALRGGRSSVNRAYRVAQDHDFTFLKTSNQVRRFVDGGYLVQLRPTADFELNAVSFPYARPEVELFVERLSGQYHRACGERLVVTSLTRPLSRQPRNASDRSVHPTGMAVDLRRPQGGACRVWLERVLLQLEGSGVLDATLERRPPHYHVALFPRQYRAYVSRLQARRASAPVEVAPSVYTVRRGDSLWEIARVHDTTVHTLKDINHMDGNRIYAGQVLAVPGR